MKKTRKKTNQARIFFIISFIVVVLAFINIYFYLRIGNSNPTDVQASNPGTGTSSPIPSNSFEKAEDNINAAENPVLVDYSGPVEHIFTHCLIAFPDLAYKSNSPKQIIKSTYFIDMITVSELKECLNKLYKNDYVLINLNDIYEKVEKNGFQTVALKKSFKFPKGKKPLVLSFDDVVYDSRKKGQGLVDKLIIKDEKIMTYTKLSDGTEVISDDNEFVPIIEKFIEEHPDFSYNGAKGMLCMTGFEGVFGYRTQWETPEPLRTSEIQGAKKVAELLKKNGWYFGSHSYGHGNMATVSNEKFLNDCKQWNDEVKTIIGDTCIYIYPYGANVKDGPKHEALLDYGFRFFCGVGSRYYCSNRNDMKGIFMDRASLDGKSLVKNRDILMYSDDRGDKSIFRFFDSKEIFSPIERKMTFEQAYDAFYN